MPRLYFCSVHFDHEMVGLHVNSARIGKKNLCAAGGRKLEEGNLKCNFIKFDRCREKNGEDDEHQDDQKYWDEKGAKDDELEED